MTGHIHAENMRLYAEDAATHEKPWELWEGLHSNYGWADLIGNPVWSTETQYRRKPRTISINGFEVPEPMRHKPEKGIEYYIVTFNSDDCIEDYTWCEDRWDMEYLSLGICHTTKEAAEIHAKALLSFTQKNGESNE